MSDTTGSQAATTRFCARVIGPLLLIVGAVVLVRFDNIALMIPGILRDGPLTFVTGMFALIVGMILFVAHHHWSSPTAILVSILGLATIVRGVILMTAPNVAVDVATWALANGPSAWIAAGIAMTIGLWLTYAGWIAKAA